MTRQSLLNWNTQMVDVICCHCYKLSLVSIPGNKVLVYEATTRTDIRYSQFTHTLTFIKNFNEYNKAILDFCLIYLLRILTSLCFYSALSGKSGPISFCYCFNYSVSFKFQSHLVQNCLRPWQCRSCSCSKWNRIEKQKLIVRTGCNLWWIYFALLQEDR